MFSGCSLLSSICCLANWILEQHHQFLIISTSLLEKVYYSMSLPQYLAWIKREYDDFSFHHYWYTTWNWGHLLVQLDLEYFHWENPLKTESQDDMVLHCSKLVDDFHSLYLQKDPDTDANNRVEVVMIIDILNSFYLLRMNSLTFFTVMKNKS